MDDDDKIEMGREQNKEIPLVEEGYSFDIYKGKLTVFSECCSSEVTREQAVAIRALIDEWLERNG